jgi:hypothetical protein
LPQRLQNTNSLRSRFCNASEASAILAGLNMRTSRNERSVFRLSLTSESTRGTHPDIRAPPSGQNCGCVRTAGRQVQAVLEQAPSGCVMRKLYDRQLDGPTTSASVLSAKPTERGSTPLSAARPVAVRQSQSARYGYQAVPNDTLDEKFDLVRLSRGPPAFRGQQREPSPRAGCARSACPIR